MPRIVMSITVRSGSIDLTTHDLPPDVVADVMAAVRAGARPSVDGVLHSTIPAAVADAGLMGPWSAVDAMRRRVWSWLRWGR